MLALLAAAALVRGVDLDGWQALLVAAAIFMVARAILRPLLILLTCPLEILTLGLFIVIINALVFAFTAWISGKLSIGFHVDGFIAALLGSLVVSGVYFIAAGFLRRQLRRGRFLAA
jgi:putative membrane protein